MANTFLAAKGFNIGKSKIEKNNISIEGYIRKGRVRKMPNNIA